MKKVIWLVVILLLGGAGYYAYTNNLLPSTQNKEEKILSASKEVLMAMASKDYQKLENLTSSAGLSYDMYLQPDYSTSDIPKAEISDIGTNTKLYLWGYSVGRGDPVMLTRAAVLGDRLKFLNAPQIAVNKTLGGGNSTNTIPLEVEGRDFIAFYYPNEGEKLNWKALYPVFDFESGEYKLRGVVLDSWSI